MSRATYHLEQVWFTSSVDRLIAARQHGIEISGLTAYLSFEKRGLRPLLQFSYEEIYDPEHKERLQRMGQYVELAADLSQNQLAQSEWLTKN